MPNLLFLPFILFENLISSIARSLNIEPPPQIFSQLGQGQRLLPPPPQEFFRSAGIQNLEEEEVLRDERGFIVKRTIRRKVEES